MKLFLEVAMMLSAATLTLFAGAREALAQQNQGFSIDRFDPAARSSDWFAADSLDLHGHGRLILGATADWAKKPLVLYAPGGDEQRAIIEDQLFVHLGADVLIGDRLRLGVNLPIAVYQRGSAVTIGATRFASSNDTAVGDLRIAADLRIAGSYRAPIELAIGVAGYIPTGKEDAFTGDGKARVAPRVLVAGELGAFMYAARLGLTYRANDGGFAGARSGSEGFVTGAVGLRLVDDRLVIGPELYGATSVTDGDAFLSRRTTPLEVLFGVHYLAGSARFGAGFGPGVTRGIGAPEFRGLLGLEWAPPTRSDPLDRDHDGVFDRVDACPDIVGVANTNGCPPERDRDQDEIVDGVDACPDEPGVKNGDPKSNGCPPPKDRDKDGVIDTDDACMDEPGITTDDPKTDGCPPPRDRDKDGVLDDLDACPDAPGSANSDPTKNGCPEVRIEHGQIMVLERVEFENNSAKIRPGSQNVLSAVLDVLKSHPEFTKLGVEGYTDNRGKAAYNQDLSRRRASSVLTWLVTHGIARARLSAQGYGTEKPVDTNDTDDGRQNNRRVEFHILEGDASRAVESR